MNIWILKMLDLLNVAWKHIPKKSIPQFNTSVPHKDHTFSAQEIPQFNTTNPKSHTTLKSTPKIPQFNTKTPSVQHHELVSSTPSLSSTQKKTLISTHPSVSHRNPSVQNQSPPQFHTPLNSTQKIPQFNTQQFRSVLNWEVLSVELRDFRCGPEGFRVWNWGILEAEKGSCPFLWNWCVELRGLNFVLFLNFHSNCFWLTWLVYDITLSCQI